MIALLALAALAHSPAQLAEVAATAEMEVAEVEAAIAGLEPRQSVLDAIASPWERQPWHTYQGIFLTEERAAAGREFGAAHAETLARAEETYGVPPRVVLAILGVETKYGRVQGDHPVLDCLYTLGFHHERRGAFFRKELGHFLRLRADEGWADPVSGSWAGAMGMGQFIPSSYRRWAVDFDGDGTRDLFGNPVDAIGSIAHYLAEHGWTPGAPVLVEAQVSGEIGDLLDGKLDLNWTIEGLAARGVTADAPATAKARLFAFELADGVEHRVGLHNFWVITRYNRSPLYARVVWELAERIAP